MANTLFPKGKEKILSAAINFTADTIKVALLSNAYSYNASHEFLSDVSASIINSAKTLASKTLTNGAFDAADVTFLAVASGQTGKAVVIYKDTGTEETSPVLAYLDGITGFPFAGNGGDVLVQWDNGSYKIFSL